MISMHCPACGAEGRIPNDKVNIRLTCKRCCKGFYLTPDGRIVAGSPPEEPHAHYEAPSHELDHVDEEIDLVVGKIRELFPKVAMGLGALLLLLLVWPFLRGEKPRDVDSRATLVAQALARNDVAALRAMSVSGTADAAAELCGILAPAFLKQSHDYESIPAAVEVSRKPDAPGPGLSEVIASIRPGQPVNRVGFAVHDLSTDLNGSPSVLVPIVVSGDDRSGWWLDGSRTLEAYRKAQVVDAAQPPSQPAPTKPTSGRRRAAAEAASGALSSPRSGASPRA